MTHLEIAQAQKLGFQRMNSPLVGHILWRRIGRGMTIVICKTGEEHEEDLDQELRVDVPEAEDTAGNRAWAELLAESFVNG